MKQTTHAKLLVTLFVLSAVFFGLASTTTAQNCSEDCDWCDQSNCETTGPDCLWMTPGPEGFDECVDNSTCWSINDSGTCAGTADCAWVADMTQCMPLDYVDCFWFMENTTCMQYAPQCTWIVDGSMGMCMLNCSQYDGDQIACEDESPDCEWNVTDNYSCNINKMTPPAGVNCTNFCFACMMEENASAACNASDAICSWWEDESGWGNCEFASDNCSENCHACETIDECLGNESFRDPSNSSASGCAWDSWGCFVKMPGAECDWECPACTTENDCLSNLDCAWETVEYNNTNYSYCSFGFGGNCNVDCWGCQNESDCNTSSAGECQWMDDPMGGHCEWSGGGNCFSFCGDCGSESDCNSSGEDCQWTNPPWRDDGGYECLETCSADNCWHCFTEGECTALNGSCEWDSEGQNCYEVWEPDCATNCYDCWDQAGCENSTGQNSGGADCWWDPQWNSCQSAAWDTCDNLCHACSDNASCEDENRTWDCTWIENDSFCYEPHEAVDCSVLAQWDCDGNPNCQWDYGLSECRPYGGGGDLWQECQSQTSQSDCNWREQCYWNHSNLTTGQYCVFKCQASTQSQCEALGDYCFWDWALSNGNGNCSYEFGAGGCYAFPTQTECLTKPWCTWDSAGSFCVEEGLSCGPGLCYMCADETECTGAEGCYWDQYKYECWEDGGGFSESPCWNESLNSSQCESILGCLWLGEEEGCDTMMPCEVIEDANVCWRVIGCTWNGTDCMERCDSYENQTECNAAGDCNWETFDGNVSECVPFMTCGFNYDQWVCEEDPDCSWDYGMQQCMNTPYCERLGDNQSACEADPSCVWDSSTYMCIRYCRNITDSGVCNASAGCFWEPMMQECLAKMPCQTINVSNQSGKNLCNAVEKCQYDQYGPNGAGCYQMDEMSFQGGVNCDGFYDQYSCESMGQGECLWTGFQCVSTGGGTNPECFEDCGFCYSPFDCEDLGPDLSAPAGSDCAWNYEYAYCYWDCEDATSESDCTSKPGCEWDSGAGLCVTSGTGNPCDDNCFNCWDEWSCLESTANCQWSWDNWLCSSQECDIKCSKCQGEQSCAQSKVYTTKNYSCVWNETNQSCRQSTCADDCRSCFNETDCGASAAGCYWDADAVDTRRKCNFDINVTNSSYACDYGCACEQEYECWEALGQCSWFYDESMENNGYCYRDLCMDNCSACSQDWMCWGNPDCSWDYGTEACVYGSGGDQWTCANDCWSCANEIDCNNSNATGKITSLNQSGGCVWAYDSWMQTYACQDSRFMPLCENTDPYLCFDSESNCSTYNDTASCEADSSCMWDYMMGECMLPCPPIDCSACSDEASCVNGSHVLPYMGPWAPAFNMSCEWSYDSGFGGYICQQAGAGGPGSGCPMYDFTSRATCEANEGCAWDSVTELCEPDMSQLPCAYLCANCGNESECLGNPVCMWDNNSGTCFEDQSNFNFGGDCDANCFDCFSESLCNGSTAGCKWITDPGAPEGSPGGWCDLNTTVTCEDDCFMCWDQDSCENVGQPNALIEELIQKDLALLEANCTGLNESNCTATDGCEWNVSECIASAQNATGCEWDSQNWFCRPTGTQVEVCFTPEDDDDDGMVNCQDPDCGMSPDCGYGFGGDDEGPMGLDVECWQWDEREGGNESVCQNYTNGTATGCCWHDESFTLQNGTEVSEGLCDPCFNENFFAGMENGPPIPLMPPDAPCNGDADDVDNPDQDWIDICDIGIRETDSILGFVAHVVDMPGMYEGTKDLVLCNYLYPDSANQTGKYYFYLDTDTDESTGCDSRDGLWSGFEYELAYIVNQSANGTTQDTRWAKRCNNATGNFTYKSATMSGKKDETCQFNGVYLAIDKGDLANLASDLRICAATGNESTDDTNPVDVTDECVYYTPGAVDFTPPDCFADPTKCGSGFQGDYFKGEDCVETPDEVDEDGDGLADCADPDCFAQPWCSASYNCSVDTSYPETKYTTVDQFKTKAIVNWMNTEPTQGKVRFYGAGSRCTGNYTNYSESENFNNFHIVELEGLTSNTTYYYKTSSCDQACSANGTWQPNCAVSGCLNFTTRTGNPNITVGYQYQPPTQNPSNPLGRLSILIDCDGDGISDYNVTGGNATANETKNNCTIEITNQRSTDPWCINVYGATLKRGLVFELTGALFANNTNESSNETDFVVGLDTQQWNKIVQNLGASHVGLCLPNDEGISLCGGAACNSSEDCNESNATLIKCDNAAAACVDVGSQGEVTYCDDSEIRWRVPASMGFSVYGLAPPLPGSTTTSTTTTLSGSSTSSTSTTSTLPPTTCPAGDWCLPDYMYSGWNLISLSFVP